MSRILTCTVPPEADGRRVRSLLRSELRIPDGMIARLRQRPGAVLLNGESVRTIDPVRAGDVLTVDVGDGDRTGAFAPMRAPLPVLFEDDDLLIINKAAGMATHGRAERGEPTVANAAAAYLGAGRPFHPVTRLDRDTSGVMVVAKTGYVHERLRLMLHSADFRREYLAVVRGVPLPASGEIALPIAKIADKKFGVRPDGAPSLTRYETLSGDGEATLLRVTPETGRTHQIRVHFSAVGCPLLGDRLYGGASDEIARCALHSSALTLLHPVTGAVIEVSAPLPEDMREVLEKHEIAADIL